MPQLMPLNWNFSIFVIYLLLMMLIMVYGDFYNKMMLNNSNDNDNNYNYKNLFMKNKWFW